MPTPDIHTLSLHHAPPNSKVDIPAPSAPALTASGSSAGEFASGSTLFYNPQGSNAGSFTITGTSSDGESGIEKLNFPSVSGMSGGGDVASSPYQASYGGPNSELPSRPHTVTPLLLASKNQTDT